MNTEPFKINDKGIFFKDSNHFGMEFDKNPTLKNIDVAREVQRFLNLAYESGLKDGCVLMHSKTETKSNDENPLPYAGAFGMLEMEIAAKIIVDKFEGAAPKRLVSVSLNDFSGNNQAEVGFLHLLQGGWMRKFMYNGNFIPVRTFWERLKMEVPEIYNYERDAAH